MNCWRLKRSIRREVIISLQVLFVVCGPDALAVGVARVGQHDQFICYGTLKELRDVDFGAPLHSLILCSPDLHEMELEMLNCFHVSKLNKSNWHIC